MKHKLLKIILIVVAVLAVIAALEFFFFTGLGTSFARACSKIEVGMPKETVLEMMTQFENKNGVELISKNGELTYVSVEEHYSGFYECTIYLNEENRVKDIFDKFD